MPAVGWLLSVALPGPRLAMYRCRRCQGLHSCQGSDASRYCRICGGWWSGWGAYDLQYSTRSHPRWSGLRRSHTSAVAWPRQVETGGSPQRDPCPNRRLWPPPRETQNFNFWDFTYRALHVSIFWCPFGALLYGKCRKKWLNVVILLGVKIQPKARITA